MRKVLLRRIIILACFVLCLALASCKKDAEDKTTAKEPVNEGTVSWSEDGKNDSGRDPSDKTDLSGLLSQTLNDEADEEKVKSAYMDFLADKELATADFSEDGYFREGNRYSFSEMIEMYIKNEAQYIDDYEIGLMDAQYAYIDCGNDGSPEMAVQLTYQIYGEFNRVYFFKYKDDEVHLIGSDEWGYRSIMELNSLGYVINGGSGGAATWVNDHYYFNAKGEKVFLYNFEQQMDLKTPRIPKFYMKNGFDRDDYPDDEFEVDGFMVYIYNFNRYVYDENAGPDDTYDNYYSKNMYCFLDNKERDVDPDSRFETLYKREGVKWYSLSEIEKLVKEHESDLGVTDEIRDAAPAEWESIIELGIMKHPVIGDDSGAYDDGSEDVNGEASYGQENHAPQYIIYNDHDKPYQSSDTQAEHSYTPVTLKEESCVENDITDTYKWFEKTGTSEPGTSWSDDHWRYELTGDKGYGTMSVINVYLKDSYEPAYTFDLSDFTYETGYENKDYVDRGIHYCKIVDDYLYLNLYHRTYSEDCPENAYIICIDITNGSVVWISDPLVSNSDNFVIIGDNLITGYGFTAEDDYIYTIDRYNGRVDNRIKVKKSPDYFAVNGGNLYVRTYSYDYAFSMK